MSSAPHPHDPEASFEVVTTESGARAVRDRTSGEVMHPVVGPALEAARLYVEPSRLAARLAEPAPGPLVLLDVGLGAAGNALAAIKAACGLAQVARPLAIVSIDRTLAPLRLAAEPAHAEALGLDASVRPAVAALLDHHAYEGARFGWRLALGDLLGALADEPSGSADIVFWDPYSPRTDPAPWSVAAFRALRRVCRAGATVHTYSAATSTRTALLLAGFYVGLGPRSGRKHRPTTIAATTHEDLEAPLGPAWLRELARARVPLPDDAPADALTQLAAHPQLCATAPTRM